jgi:hypothetical protein
MSIEATRGLLKVTLVDDVVAFENHSRLVARQLHRYPFRHASPDQISDCRASEVVRNALGTSSGDARLPPRFRITTLGYSPSRFPTVCKAEDGRHNQTAFVPHVLSHGGLSLENPRDGRPVTTSAP